MVFPRRIPGKRARLFALAAATIIVAVSVIPATAKAKPGFLTSQPAMLTALTPGGSVTPIITVGDTIGSYRFESIPDGISILPISRDTVDVFVNHETSTVPFPYTPAAPTETNSQNDFDNAQVSKLTLHQKSLGVLSTSYAIPSSAGFQRFCSNFLVSSEHGFSRPMLFTNEEAVDWVNRSGKAWPATIGAPQARQAGAVVAYDVQTGAYQPIWGMGRHNHENNVGIPGYGQPVLLSTDDTFTNNPSQSQLYMYRAADADAVWNDAGDLWAFVSDNATRQKYEDFAPGDTTAIEGHFIQVPKPIATGRNPDGTDMMAAQVPEEFWGPDGPFDPPPNDGTWQRDPNGIGIDGPQWVLQEWSRRNGVFGFVRLEDLAYDRTNPNVVYIVDSGRGTTGAAGAGKSTNGRVWEMVLDPTDPTQVDSLRILIEGDDNPVKTPTEMHQPDNMESTASALYFTEDPGSSQQFAFGSTDPAATTARIWRYELASGAMTVVASVNQSADEGPTDVDGTTTRGNLGAWESSGIIDVSSVFGRGTFLVTIQAHTLWVQKAPGDDNVSPPVGPDFTYKREGGQLVLLRLPGS